jgi:serine/threonine-protein kinase RsbW
MWQQIKSWFQGLVGKKLEVHVWQFRVKKSRAEIGALNEKLERYCFAVDVPEPALRTLQMSLDELLTNAICYGGVTDANPATVLVRAENQTLSAKLIYPDNDFNPFTDSQRPDLDASIADRHVGGLGVHLVKTMMDNVQYQHHDGLSTILISKTY